MRDPARIDRILAKLRTYWLESPDMRLCQMMYALSPGTKMDLFTVEDSVIEASLDEYVRNLRGED